MKASIAELVRLPGVWRGGELEHAAQPALPTGHARLDAELPGGGWPTGTLTEVLHDGVGIGELTFLSGALARASEGDRLIAWINPPHLPYAPALAQAGLALDRCLVVRPVTREDSLWAAEQAMKSGACGAVLLWLGDEVGARRHDEYAWLRRLQMSAEAGRCMAVYFRATAAQPLSTPAHLRVALTCEDGALRIRIPKRRGPPLAAPLALPLASRPGFVPQQQPQSPIPQHGAPSHRRALHLVGR